MPLGLRLEYRRDRRSRSWLKSQESRVVESTTSRWAPSTMRRNAHPPAIRDTRSPSLFPGHLAEPVQLEPVLTEDLAA